MLVKLSCSFFSLLVCYHFLWFIINSAICSSVRTSVATISVVAVRSNFGIGIGCSSGWFSLQYLLFVYFKPCIVTFLPQSGQVAYSFSSGLVLSLGLTSSLTSCLTSSSTSSFIDEGHGCALLVASSPMMRASYCSTSSLN